MAHIIFVCTANICRSAMAEGIFRHLARESGKDYLTTSSMGTHAVEGLPANDVTAGVCQKHKIDLSGHLSRPLVEDELRKAAHVLCMEPVQEEFLNMFFPGIRSQVHLLGTLFADKKQRTLIIRDPMGLSQSMQNKVFKIIENHIKRLLLFF